VAGLEVGRNCLAEGVVNAPEAVPRIAPGRLAGILENGEFTLLSLPFSLDKSSIMRIAKIFEKSYFFQKIGQTRGLAFRKARGLKS
jgi:hypothetical protein